MRFGLSRIITSGFPFGFSRIGFKIKRIVQRDSSISSVAALLYFNLYILRRSCWEYNFIHLFYTGFPLTSIFKISFFSTLKDSILFKVKFASIQDALVFTFPYFHLGLRLWTQSRRWQSHGVRRRCGQLTNRYHF